MTWKLLSTSSMVTVVKSAATRMPALFTSTSSPEVPPKEMEEDKDGKEEEMHEDLLLV